MCVFQSSWGINWTESRWIYSLWYPGPSSESPTLPLLASRQFYLTLLSLVEPGSGKLLHIYSKNSKNKCFLCKDSFWLKIFMKLIVFHFTAIACFPHPLYQQGLGKPTIVIKFLTKHKCDCWCTRYWVVLGVFSLVELLLDLVINPLPYSFPTYLILKCAFLAWCMAPVEWNGSDVIFNNVSICSVTILLLTPVSDVSVNLPLEKIKIYLIVNIGPKRVSSL